MRGIFCPKIYWVKRVFFVLRGCYKMIDHDKMVLFNQFNKGYYIIRTTKRYKGYLWMMSCFIIIFISFSFDDIHCLDLCFMTFFIHSKMLTLAFMLLTECKRLSIHTSWNIQRLIWQSDKIQYLADKIW